MKQTTATIILAMVLLIAAITVTNQVYAQPSNSYMPEPGLLAATIKADGNIEPQSVNVSRNGNTYTLETNIEGYIVIELSGCVLDGAGHAVKAVYGPIPVQDGYLSQVDAVSGVKVTNTVVNGGGIIFYGLKSNSIVITNNTVINGKGIDCSGQGNLITNNTITYGRGISCGGNGNTVTANKISNTNYTFAQNNPPPYGISITGSYNTIFGNTITETEGDAIHMIVGISNNVIAGNDIIRNRVGVHTIYMLSQGGAEGNLIYLNNFVGNGRNVYNEAVVTTAVSVNFWDNGKEGNYWSNYNGQGTYVIDESNVDNHPFTTPVDISKLDKNSFSRPPIPTPIPSSTPMPSTTPMPTATISLEPSQTPKSNETTLPPSSSSNQDLAQTATIAAVLIVIIALVASILAYVGKHKRNVRTS